MLTLKTIRTFWILAFALALPMAVFSLQRLFIPSQSQRLFIPSQSQTTCTLINTNDPLPPGAIRRFGTSRFRHGGWLWGFEFSPDGKVLATSAEDGLLRLWDTNTGKQLHQIAGHPNSRAFSPGAKILAVALADGQIHLWHTKTWNKFSELTLTSATGDQNVYAPLAFSPNGDSLAAGSDAGIELFDLTVQKKPPVFVPAPSGGMYTLGFFPDGKKLLTSHWRDKVRIISLEAKSVLRRLELKGLNVRIARSSNDGKLVAVTGSESRYVRLFDSSSGKKVRSLWIGSWSADLLFLPDNKTLLVCRIDGVLQKWDIHSGKMLWKKSIKKGGPADYEAISPDGRKLAGGFGKVIRLWDVATGREIIPAKSIEQRLICKSYSAEANLLACLDRKVVKLVDATSGRVTVQIRAPQGDDCSTMFSRDGKTLAVGDLSNPVSAYNVASGQERRRMKHLYKVVLPCSYSHDGKLLAVQNDGLRLTSIADGNEVQLPESDWVTAPTFSPDGKLVAARTNTNRWEPDAKIMVWDITSHKLLHELNGYQGDICDICFSPDGKLLLSAAAPISGMWNTYNLGQNGGDGSIIVWGAATGNHLHKVENICSGFNRIAFTPDGRTLITACQDHKVRLLETATWKQRRAFAGHRGPVDFIALSRDKRTIISACAEESILFWNILGLVNDKKTVKKITSAKLEKLWSDLAGADAKRAYQAICLLVANPDRSVAFLTKKLTPIPRLNKATITQFIIDLDNDSFAVRSRATKELTALHWCAVSALTNALKENQSLERRLRIDRLLEKLHGVAAHPKQLRFLRAVEALEYMGTNGAMKLLQKLAGGAEEALLTREARSALQRLSKKRRQLSGHGF